MSATPDHYALANAELNRLVNRDTLVSNAELIAYAQARATLAVADRLAAIVETLDDIDSNLGNQQEV